MDLVKAAQNLKKHGVDFAEVLTIVIVPYHGGLVTSRTRRTDQAVVWDSEENTETRAI